jgi:RNA polymerase sigma-70 factor (ECF subfamily)
MTASARGVPGNNFSGRRGTPPGPAGMSSIAFPMPDDLPQPLAASLPKRDQSLQHLTLRAAQGDQEAFAALHQRLGGGLHRLFMERTGGRTELADDFCQKTWVAVWQALEGGKYDPERAAISTFVYAVGYRVWLQHMRSAGRARAHLDAAAPGMAALGLSEDPAAGSRLAEMIQIVRDCLSGKIDCGLSEEERWILRASTSGVTDRDLAKRLGVAASTANTRKQAAYDKLRRHLEKLGHRAELPGQNDAGGE